MLEIRWIPPLLGVFIVGWVGAGCCPSSEGTDGAGAGASGPLVVGAENAGNWVKLSATSQGLQSLVKAEVAKARGRRLKPIVYVGAGWCEPCRAIHAHQRDPRMVDAFKGTYVIELDMDDWGAGDMGALGYETKAIPVFMVVGDDASARGPKIDGGAWGDNIPENMAPPLKRFFAGVS